MEAVRELQKEIVQEVLRSDQKRLSFGKDSTERKTKMFEN